MVSHDLALIDETIEKILKVNTHTRKIDEYSGNFSDYKRIESEEKRLIQRKITSEKAHIKRMEKGLIKMQRYTSEKGVRQRTNLKKRIERIKNDLPQMPPELNRIKIILPDPLPTGELPLKASGIYKAYDYPVLQNVNLTIYKNERVALIGPNGAGKSTLIKILMKKVEQDSGEVLYDKNLSIGYYSQEFEDMDLRLSLIELLEKESDLSEEKIRAFLARFYFKDQKVFQKIETLSGGEKTRLSIARLVLKNHNLLILDEPTTYLDPLSQRLILEALKSYKGAMIIVSHTEEFIEELNPARALFLPENKTAFWSQDLLELVGET